VEIIRPQAAPVYHGPVTTGLPRVVKEEKKSLITRVIQRIQSL